MPDLDKRVHILADQRTIDLMDELQRKLELNSRGELIRKLVADRAADNGGPQTKRDS